MSDISGLTNAAEGLKGDASRVSAVDRSSIIERLEDRQMMSVSVVYHKGPLLRHVRVETIYVGSNWTKASTGLPARAAALDTFFKSITNSQYMDILQQYGVSRGSWVGHDFVKSGPASGTISAGKIEQILASEASHHRIPKGGDTLYMVFTQNGVLTGPLGYHTAAPGMPFAVVQYEKAFSSHTIVASHELTEAVTDPYPYTGWATHDGQEIADLAQGARSVKINGYYVAQVWDQKHHKPGY